MHDSSVTAPLPDTTRKGIQSLLGLLEENRKRLGNDSLVDIARQLIAQIDYQGELKRLYPDPNDQQSRWASVEEVVNAIGAYESKARRPSLAEFLDDVALGGQNFDDEKDKQLRRNAVVLMTLHSAKGLEFPHVYLVGLEEGILPHHRSLADDEAGVAEERRLCYVGITRAQDRLTLSMALTRMKWGKPRESIPSRFLYEAIGKAENPVASNGRRAGSRLATNGRGGLNAGSLPRRTVILSRSSEKQTRKPAARRGGKSKRRIVAPSERRNKR
jgi:DNA helicase-2/ATP-dependent DNA helicase PcrA